MSKPCVSCQIATGEQAAPFIYEDTLWTVNLLLNENPPKPVLGWSVLQPRRHVLSLSELAGEEEHTLGPLLKKCELAMKEVLGVEKVYICLFAEDTDFHLHFHLIPRQIDIPKDYIGPGIFRVQSPEFELASLEERNSVRDKLRYVLKNHK